MRRYHPAIAYILPFLVFMMLLALQQIVPAPIWLRLVLPLAAAAAVSRHALSGRPSQPLMSAAIGIAVFVFWVAPDLIFPAWRHGVLFNNPLVGHPAGNTPPALRNDPWFLSIRIAISVAAVPVLEELFWRGWLMRWIIDSENFERVPPGAYSAAAFWMVALLFASEHGSFWDVGLLAGIVFNLWMIRTRNLWDCILAHAVANGILASYVVLAGQWQYWL